MKGMTLRLSRLRLGLRQRDVAAAAGFSPARVGQVEQLRKVPPVWVVRYRGALKDSQSTNEPAGAGETPPAG